MQELRQVGVEAVCCAYKTFLLPFFGVDENYCIISR